MPTDLHRAPSLAPPFAVVGLVGGWAVADAFGVESHETGIRLLLLLVTAVVAGVLGYALTHRARNAGRFSALGLLLGAFLAGPINGAIIGLIAGSAPGAVVGVIMGGFCTFPFLPALGLVLWTAHRALAARAGSIARAARVRGMWAATALSCAVGGPLGLALGASGHPYREVRPAVAFAFALGAVASIVVLALLDAVALLRLRRLEASLGTLRAGQSPAVSVPVVDFGIGNEVLIEVEPEAVAYRSMERPLRKIWGSARAAAAAVDLQLGLGIIALALACVGVSATLACWNSGCPAGPG